HLADACDGAEPLQRDELPAGDDVPGRSLRARRSVVRMSEARARAAPLMLASALAGCWRASPPGTELSCEELARVVPLLEGSGAAALAWWKVRGTSLEECAAAESLRQSYRRQALQTALQEREVEHVFELLRTAGVEPV